jgi:hypothetical protein
MRTILFPDEWHVNPRLSGVHAALGVASYSRVELFPSGLLFREEIDPQIWLTRLDQKRTVTTRCLFKNRTSMEWERGLAAAELASSR